MDCGLWIGDCGLGIGDWGLGIVDCGVGIGGGLKVEGRRAKIDLHP